MQGWLHKSFLFGLIITEIGVVAGFWVWTADTREQHATQKEKHLRLTEKEVELKETIAYQLAYRDALTQDRVFAESVARDKLGYAAPDELIFIIPDTNIGAFESDE